MSKVHGWFPKIYSTYCYECKKVSVPEIPTEMFCKTCESPLYIRMKSSTKGGVDTNIVRPIRVRDMLARSHRYSRFLSIPHSFQGEWRNVLNVEWHKSKAGKVAVAIEKHTVVACDPEDVFLELFGGWDGSWESPTKDN
ncbi:hypothetical protein B0G52_11899 [Cohnella sp. SGD-V74]|uniref:hypothetical protein n=1 Tax=unclassified Cohnella TaxID=2636738 RepID=UPI000D4AF203|nr:MULTISPECIES: hypothetical protein [unclassified Cohnella]PRX65148.1 hypothetical protein B0G52_11899 [Cohnella sp. SGD-V74]